VRFVLAIICGLFLAGTQIFSPVANATAGANGQCEVPQCSCERCTCACDAAPDSSPVPIAPVRSNCHQQELSSLLVLRVIYDLSSPLSFGGASYTSPPVLSSAVPIYQRNCTFLI